MKITWRILLAFLVFLTIGFYLQAHSLLKDLRPRYLEALEETLIDTSRLLSAQLEKKVSNGRVDTKDLAASLAAIKDQKFSAQVYGMEKTTVKLRVYVTDDKGKVIFDSDDGRDLGKDYSRWNDVYLCLKGRYGARATRKNQEDPNSSTLYVAAPILQKGKILGVVSVGKPSDSVNLFIQTARRKALFTSLIIFFSILAMTLGVSLWIARPVKKLIEYANGVKDGRRAALPDLGQNEMGDLGRAFENMREALEGKKYVEEYVQLLTHELKSPLSAIRGAAELLEEKMPPTERRKFLKNIQSETARIQDIVDRLLLLSSVESRRSLENIEAVDLPHLIEEVVESFQAKSRAQKISILTRIPTGLPVEGDPFLMRQALANLLQNALEFSPPKSKILVSAQNQGKMIEIRVEDSGPGIPSFALDRVFEKFYSLQRPDTGRKSSGLGLSLVKEVASLHGGAITLENRPEGGARAILSFPLQPLT